MSIFPLQLQIISDLHLETPLISPSYTSPSLDVHASNLCLLGDIGLVKDDGLFAFLRATLERSRGHRIFYIIGNHEAYQMSYELAVQKLRDFEDEARADFGGRFILLNRDRFDLDASTTVLGCTLWSAISAEQASEAQARLTDFNERGIRTWSLEDHLIQHQKDLEWLNTQVQDLQEKEPHRQVAILTHHSPTVDTRATNAQHRGSSMSTCFATDLSNELSWTSSNVKLWAFGHTHYSCAFRDEGTGKLVVANQKGYQQLGARRAARVKTILVEVNPAEWKITKLKNSNNPHDEAKPQSEASRSVSQYSNREQSTQKTDTENELNSTQAQRSVLRRAADRIHALRRTRTLSSK